MVSPAADTLVGFAVFVNVRAATAGVTVTTAEASGLVTVLAEGSCPVATAVLSMVAAPRSAAVVV
ncbi:hypothetical protein ACPPVW_14600 [Leifsonia sp. McL0607]|uniref:hypothetical protein n=1 Tax=Leifsonia sp. McL0607 TaxID=3415672 RepID=UPI003CF2E201